MMETLDKIIKARKMEAAVWSGAGKPASSADATI
jgi:hypothetical protein